MKTSIRRRFLWWIVAPGYPAPWTPRFWRKRWDYGHHGRTLGVLIMHLDLCKIANTGEEAPDWLPFHVRECEWCEFGKDDEGWGANLYIPRWVLWKSLWPEILEASKRIRAERAKAAREQERLL